MKCHQHAAFALLLLAIPACGHVGQRLLTVQIELDGQVVLEGIRGVPDNMPVDEMWDVLGEVAFAAKGGPPSGDLEGEVVVRIKHVDRELASANLKNLKLTPNDAGSEWSLPQGQVERIKQAASD